MELVLRRHDIANNILALDKQIKDIEKTDEKSNLLTGIAASENGSKPNKSSKVVTGKNTKSRIVTNKIAKDIQQVRKKNELVSFQCFMRSEKSVSTSVETNLNFYNTEFVVRTRSFSLGKSKGESQISMYKEFSKVLENDFHYSKLTSRSDIDIDTKSGTMQGDNKLLDDQSFLFSRLEILKNVDIFLGNNWVLEREDLLPVYPYHVHLQNYVKSFRMKYQENRGRL